jgi:MFS transporter, DHA2 family, multidrug resistance protein
LPAAQHGDGAALFTMARNVLGGIGISVSTALVTNDLQTRQGYLVEHLTPLNQPYNVLLEEVARASVSVGQSIEAAKQMAPGQVFEMLRNQVAVLAYIDVFYITGCLALAMVPLALFMTSGKPQARSGE